MKGVEYRLVMALIFIIVLVVATNFNYIFDKKKISKPEPEPEPAPGPAPGPAPETPEEEEEEEETPVIPPKGKPKMKSGTMKSTVTADIQVIDTLPIGTVKKEGYIGYSDI